MFSLFSPKKTALNSGEVLNKDFSTVIPFESKAGLLFITICINNKDYKLLLDTAAFTILSPKLLKELACKQVQDSLKTLDAFGAQKDVNIYKLPSLEIEGIFFNGFHIICDDFSHKFPFSCLEFDGILGYNLFAKLILEIDYDKQQVVLSDKESKYKGFVSSSLLLLDGGIPAFSIQVAKKVFVVGIDTGKNDGLMLGDEVFLDYCREKELARQRTLGIFSSSFSGLNKHSFIDTYLLKDFYLVKKIPITSFTVSYQENAQNIAGNTFLKNFYIIINFAKQKVYFKKIKDEIKEDFLDSFGFLTFWNEEKKLYISAIIEDTPAYQSRLKIGDKILSINDLDTINFSQKDYCEFSLLAQKSLFNDVNSVKLTIRRDAKLIQIELKL
ncbi:aspartyl protease family protein [Sulfurimonas sp. SAG-AH-194-C21]|nr:PDZ domain-containing protein [Sulfurimonas sp. SAG-AH-194-C21]MDF1882740.1 aspartyl protease family protein [Sulfurimonas sp. SAG-AH-194-C21]